MSEEERYIELTGGSPWGFSIQGGKDFGAPLKVTKVSPGGKAALAGVQLNDVLRQISGKECAALRHSEALFLIRSAGASLPLLLQQGRATPAPYQPKQHLIRSATAPSAPRSPPKRNSVQKKPPSPVATSPLKGSPVRGESVGGQDWYRAMHRSDTSDDSRPLCSSGEERRSKTPPQPIKAKPRITTAPSNGSRPLSPPQAAPTSSDPAPSPPQVPPLVPVLSPPQAAPSPSDPPPPVSSERRKSAGKKRRELKPPPAPSARGLYDFSAETKHELSFRKGELLRLLRTVDENWLEAQLGECKGIIPVSYVELCPAEGAPPDSSAPCAVARYEFLAEEEYELGFQKGARVALLSRVDDNWLQGRVEDRTGIFPAAFVDVITPLPEPPAPQAPQKPADPISAENEIRTHRSSPSPPDPSLGELYRAVYSYSPQNEDELALELGAEVRVVRRCDDGWYMGYDGSTGAFGTFPGNYVQPI